MMMMMMMMVTATYTMFAITKQL